MMESAAPFDSCDPVTGIANVPTDSLCDDNGCLHRGGDLRCGARLSGWNTARTKMMESAAPIDSCDPITGIANVPTDSLCDDNGCLHGHRDLRCGARLSGRNTVESRMMESVAPSTAAIR